MSQRSSSAESARAEFELATTLIRVACFALLLPIVANIVGALLFPAVAGELILVALWMGASSLLALLLTRVGRPRLAGVVMIALLFFVIVNAAFTGGGVRSPAYVGFLTLTFFSVWLIGLRGAVVVLVAAALVGVVLLLAEDHALLPVTSAHTVAAAVWQSLLTQMVLAVLLQGVLLRLIRRSNAAHLQSEARYRVLFDYAGDAIFACDAVTGMILDANRRACELVGHSLAKLRTMHQSELHPPAQREQIVAALKAAVAQPGPLVTDIEVLHADGRHIPVEIVTSTVDGPDGVKIVLGIFRAVGERRRIDAELRASEERFRASFEQAAVGMCHTDLEGRTLRVNSRFCAITGYSADELLTLTSCDYTHPDDQGVDAGLGAQLLCGTIPTYALEKRYLRKDGTQIWVNLTVSPVRGPDGTIVELLEVVEEITDRKLNEWALRQLNATLEDRVDERTAALSWANEELQSEVAVRRQVEQALRESEARFRRLTDNVPDMIYRYEYLPAPRFVYVSAAFTAMTGYTPEECYADSQIGNRLMHPDDVSLLRCALADPEILRGPLEMRWIHRDGSVIWVEQRNVPLLDEHGAIVAIEGVTRDITARKRDLEALRESEVRYRELLTNLRQGVVVFQDERMVFVNQALAEILGTTVEHLLACSMTELMTMLYADDRPRLRETMALAIERSSIVADDPFRFYRVSDGDVRWLHAASSLITYEGQPAILSVLSDFTELKSRDQQLRQSEARLQMLLANTPAVIFTSRADGEYDVTFASESIRTVLGYEPAQFTREPTFWSSRIHPEDAPRIFAELPRLFERGWHQHEYRFLHADGSYRWIENGMTLAHFGPGQAEIVGYLIDITGRKEAEATLRQSRDVLRSANLELARAARLKDEFLANMSHELRTPLNAVLGRAELLAEQIHGPLNERQLRSVTSIEESGRHLLELINDILDLSKIEANKLELQQEPVSVGDLCQASIRLLTEAATKKDMRISADLDPQAVVLVGDPRRLKQMLVNLLSNAVKFTPAGGSVGLEVRGDPASARLAFTVWDTGIGIAEADLPRLFRPFEQLDSRLSRQYDGTGLGLSLVARLARLHGGDIAVVSAPGKGSRFTITLPWHTCEP